MLSNEQAPTDWNIFREPLLQHVVDEKEDNSVWWIANLQRLPLTFSTYLSQFPKETAVLECDTVEEEKTNRRPDRLNTSPTFKSGSMNSALFDSLRGSPTWKSPNGSRLIPSVLGKKSAKYELKNSLINQVNNSNHIVFGLCHKFIEIFETTFKDYLEPNEEKKFTEKLEEAYNNGKNNIKFFIGILSKFIIWVYVDFIKQFLPGLNQEDFNPSAVVEDVIYQMLFDSSNSSLYKFALNAVEAKYADQLKIFEENLKSMNEIRLEEYDKNLEGSLLMLEGAQQMYGRISKRLRRIKKEISPYNKYEIIVSLDQELLTCLQNHYHNDYEKMQKVEEMLGRDAKTAIYTYCVVKSQSEHLLLDRTFIEEFVDSACLEATPHFPAFHGWIEHILSHINKLDNDNNVE